MLAPQLICYWFGCRNCIAKKVGMLHLARYGKREFLLSSDVVKTDGADVVKTEPADSTFAAGDVNSGCSMDVDEQNH